MMPQFFVYKQKPGNIYKQNAMNYWTKKIILAALVLSTNETIGKITTVAEKV